MGVCIDDVLFGVGDSHCMTGGIVAANAKQPACASTKAINLKPRMQWRGAKMVADTFVVTAIALRHPASLNYDWVIKPPEVQPEPLIFDLLAIYNSKKEGQ